MTQLLLPIIIAAPVSTGEGKPGSALTGGAGDAELADAADVFSNLLNGDAEQQAVADLSSHIADSQAVPIVNPLPPVLTADAEAVILEEVEPGVQTLLQTDVSDLLENLPVNAFAAEQPVDAPVEAAIPAELVPPAELIEVIPEQVIAEPQVVTEVLPETAPEPTLEATTPLADPQPVIEEPTPTADPITHAKLELEEPLVEPDPVSESPEISAAPENGPVETVEAPKIVVTDDGVPVIEPVAPIAESTTPPIIDAPEIVHPTDQPEPVAAATPAPTEVQTPITAPRPTTPVAPQQQPATQAPATPINAAGSPDLEQAPTVPASPQPVDERQAGNDRRQTQNAQANQVVAEASRVAGQGESKLGQQGDERSGQQSQSSTPLFELGADAPNTKSERTGRPSFASALLNAGQSAHLESEFEELPARLRIAAANGIERLTVSLRPALLGSMEVQFETAEDGALRANFIVQRPETLDLLQRDARALERALGDAGLNLDKDSLNFSLSDHGGRDGRFDQEDEMAGRFGGQATDDGDGENADADILTDIALDTAAIVEAGRIDVRI